MTHKLIGGQIALFPGLPRFYLLWRLHNTRERKSSENGERSGNIHQVNDVRWAQAGHEGGGGGQLPKQHIGSSVRVLYRSFRLQTLAWS